MSLRRTRANLLAYADDIVLVSDSCANVQSMLHTLQTEAAKVGLHVNLGKNKTEYFAMGCQPESVSDIHGMLLTQAEAYKYLGCYPTSPEKDMSSRDVKGVGSNQSTRWHLEERCACR